MADLHITGLSAAAVAAIDELADRQGLSRNEYLRRQLRENTSRRTGKLTVEDLREFGEQIRAADAEHKLLGV